MLVPIPVSGKTVILSNGPGRAPLLNGTGLNHSHSVFVQYNSQPPVPATIAISSVTPITSADTNMCQHLLGITGTIHLFHTDFQFSCTEYNTTRGTGHLNLAPILELAPPPEGAIPSKPPTVPRPYSTY